MCAGCCTCNVLHEWLLHLYFMSCLCFSAVSQEIKYKNIAQEARDKQYLLHNPHILNDFLSTERNDECPADLKEIDTYSSENTVLIPKLHQTFAQCLHASVSTLDGCPVFEVDFRNVVDSHKIETIGRLKPDTVAVDSRYKHIKFGLQGKSNACCELHIDEYILYDDHIEGS